MRNAVVLVSDAKLFPAAAFAASHIASLNNRGDTDVVIFTDAADEIRAAPSRDYPFRVMPIAAPTGIAVPSMMFRLFVPAQVKGRYGRILYLDVDTYVEDANLFGLFDLDMRGHTIAAVRDYVIACLPDRIEIEAILGNRHRRYFNSGVMLIDCARFVERRVSDAVWKMATLKTVPPRYGDQSMLNRFFDGDYLELSPAFNMFISAEGTPLPVVCPPLVTHFAGPNKPWLGGRFGYAHKARAEMERYFPASPWRAFLSRFADVSAPQRPPSIAGGFQDAAPIAEYLRTIEFADVTAGLTTLHLDALPPTAPRPK